jgi:hypothetical protein
MAGRRQAVQIPGMASLWAQILCGNLGLVTALAARMMSAYGVSGSLVRQARTLCGASSMRSESGILSAGDQVAGVRRLLYGAPATSGRRRDA